MDDWKDLIEYPKFIKVFILYQALHYPIKSLKNSFQAIKNYIKIVNYPVQTIIQIKYFIYFLVSIISQNLDFYLHLNRFYFFILLIINYILKSLLNHFN